jgi:hypothetical protein
MNDIYTLIMKAMICVEDFNIANSEKKETLKFLNEAKKQAIDYTSCCKSDSEQLIAFSDWVFEQPLHLGGNERKLVKQYLEGN